MTNPTLAGGRKHLWQSNIIKQKSILLCIMSAGHSELSALRFHWFKVQLCGGSWMDTAAASGQCRMSFSSQHPEGHPWAAQLTPNPCWSPGSQQWHPEPQLCLHGTILPLFTGGYSGERAQSDLQNTAESTTQNILGLGRQTDRRTEPPLHAPAWIKIKETLRKFGVSWFNTSSPHNWPGASSFNCNKLSSLITPLY